MLCSYIKGLLGAPTPAEFNALKSENEVLQKQLQDAQNQVQELAAKVRRTPGTCSKNIEELLPTQNQVIDRSL